MNICRVLIVMIPIAGIAGLVGCSEGRRISQIEEQNKALAQRIHSEVSKGNLGIFHELLSSDHVRHCQAMPPDFQEPRRRRNSRHSLLT